MNITRLYQGLRQFLVSLCQVPVDLQATVEVDKSYFGQRRVCGKRGGEVGRNTIVFGLFKRGGQVYVEIVPDCAKTILQAITGSKIAASAVAHSVVWCGYNGLVEVGYDEHFRV